MREGLRHFLRAAGIVSVVYTGFCLFFTAIFALIVQAVAPSGGVIVGVNLAIKTVGLILCGLFLVRGERALLCGAGAGGCGCVVCMILFGVIGGFSVSAFFFLELLLSAIVCGGAARLGSYFRKD